MALPNNDYILYEMQSLVNLVGWAFFCSLYLIKDLGINLCNSLLDSQKHEDS